ncbi:lamin tail domain-containing protein [Streptomyces goshikiensis]|uniref:lamin tail domain-containing protein n=1 Tax=Streptomyces goshikiensis TaxID=1942 RepID=UPI0033A21FC1
MPRTRRLAAGAAITAATVLLLPGQAHAAGTLRISKIWYDSPGSDTGANTSLNGEWVQITNSTSTAVSLKDWTLTDASRHAYTFPTFTLKPGKTVTVKTGRGTNTTTTLYQQRGAYVWNNDKDTATLRRRQRHPPPHLRLQLHPPRLQNLLNQTARSNESAGDTAWESEAAGWVVVQPGRAPWPG